jgi:hypothetical protein
MIDLYHKERKTKMHGDFNYNLDEDVLRCEDCGANWFGANEKPCQ